MKEFSNKKPYLSPQLTVVEFRVERGYISSGEELQITTQSEIMGIGLMGQEYAQQNDGSGFETWGSNEGYFGNGGFGGSGDWF